MGVYLEVGLGSSTSETQDPEGNIKIDVRADWEVVSRVVLEVAVGVVVVTIVALAKRQSSSAQCPGIAGSISGRLRANAARLDQQLIARLRR